MLKAKNFVLTFIVLLFLALPFASSFIQTGSDSGSIVTHKKGSMIIVGVTPPVCGNNIFEIGEQCDGTDLNGQTCTSLNPGWTGTLSCQSNCIYDTSGCSIIPQTPSNPPGGTGSNPSGGSPSTNNNPASTPPSNSGSCVENWKCNDWSNVNEQCGTRTCEDLNKCGTTQLKPKVSEKCSTVGFLSFTGAVTGIGNFAKSGEGIATFLGLIMVVVLTILITSIRRKRLTNEKNSEVKVKIE